ncbi:hypothetical protein LTR17_004317 [Elasticomyces elasticus]|nr:hypothetical protein LTR17_004317 [Elasticomyces elasticus]
MHVEQQHVILKRSECHNVGSERCDATRANANTHPTWLLDWRTPHDFEVHRHPSYYLIIITSSNPSPHQAYQMANRANIVEFTRPKNNKGADDGRLCIGHRKKDWAKAYYSPASTRDDLFADEEDDDLYNHSNPPTLAIFSESGGKLKACEPMEGEIAWYPHYDYLNSETGDKKEKKHLQKEFLFDCWKYCAVTDPARLATMEARFAHKNFTDWPRWRSWYDMAVRWKQPRQARRTARRRGGGGSGGGGGGTLPGGGPRRPGPHPDGGPNSDLDSDDEGYDDDGEEGLGRNDGPGRHEGSGRPGSMGPPSWKRKGSGAGTNGQKAKRPKSGTNGSGSSSRSQEPDEFLMSGGAGSPPASRARTTYSPGINGDDLDDDDDPESLDYDTRHPTMDPEPGSPPNGVNGVRRPSLQDRLNNRSRTPSGTLGAGLNGSPNAPGRRRESSIVPNNDLRPFNDWGLGATGSPTRGARPGGARPGTLGGNGRGLFGNAQTQNIVDLNDEPDADDDNIDINPVRGGIAQRESAARGSRALSVIDVNGADVDEDEATRLALLRSEQTAADEAERLASERAVADDEDANDPDLQRAIRASVEPRSGLDRPPSGEQGSPNDVHQSIEDGEDEDDP